MSCLCNIGHLPSVPDCITSSATRLPSTMARSPRYAIGGATAATFYVEPLLTFDLDVFVALPHVGTNVLSLGPLTPPEILAHQVEPRVEQVERCSEGNVPLTVEM